jgi:hypothetical protein
MEKILLTTLLAALGTSIVMLAPLTTAIDFTTSVTKDGTHYRAEPYHSSRSVYDELDRGDKARFNCYIRNEHGNDWFKDDNENWIFSGNVVRPNGVPECR